jgi:hypothetical protein
MVTQYRPVWNKSEPFTAVSFDTSLIFKTGSQRSERPVFIDKVAPCFHACPIGIDIPTAFYMASKGDIDGALRIYLKENPLPGVCGRVCYHPCEAECNRGSFDESINTRSFERFLSDHGQVDIKRDVSIMAFLVIAYLGLFLTVKLKEYIPWGYRHALKQQLARI